MSMPHAKIHLFYYKSQFKESNTDWTVTVDVFTEGSIMTSALPLVNNVLMVMEDSRTVLSSCTMSTNSFYHHRKVTEGQPSAKNK